MSYLAGTMLQWLPIDSTVSDVTQPAASFGSAAGQCGLLNGGHIMKAISACPRAERNEQVCQTSCAFGPAASVLKVP